MADSRRKKRTPRKKKQADENVDPEIKGNDSGDLDLALLNRHWYRRCLDSLSDNLSSVGRNPSVEKRRELANKIITGFLTAVAGQAPDSDRLQFPADRAYFIPLEGDIAGRFNYVKAYYQLMSCPDNYSAEEAEDSLWSFFPWHRDLGRSGVTEKTRKTLSAAVRIPKYQSCHQVREQGAADGEARTTWQTISFEQLIATAGSKNQQTADNSTVTDDEEVIQLRKSLLLPQTHDQTLQNMFRERKKHGGSDVAAHRFHKMIRSALLSVFEIYRSMPGNSGVELLLLNHVNLLRWFAQFSMTLEGKQSEAGAVSQKNESYDALLVQLLEVFFLDGENGSSVLEDSPEDRAELLKDLTKCVDLREESEMEETTTRVSAAKDRKLLSRVFIMDRQEDFAPVHQTPFAIGVLKRFEAAQGTEKELSLKEIAENELEESLNHLQSFFRYFLRADIETNLERDLISSGAIRDDDPRRAGHASESFVWVCPDFEDVNDGLPEVFRRDPDEDADLIEFVEGERNKINEVYREFFREHELAMLEPYFSQIRNYWRTRGQASRSHRIYASFEHRDGLSVPDSLLPKRRGKRPAAVPQNIFLRVRVCDSANEPIINGLCVFTTDHDEVQFKGKSPALRHEDVEDLLAFAKVYFFLVRDYMHGLDRARDAADIGRLNQYLYDRRLSDLDHRMTVRMNDDQFRERDVTQIENWQKFTYEVINNYAFSLIDKPHDVRTETFPFDRLLIVPLESSHSARPENDRFSLPFFLFQAIYAENHDGRIESTHYSLLRPFQSPVEIIDAQLPDRFSARTFQKMSVADGGAVRLSRFIEKMYLGATDFVPSQVDRSVKQRTESGTDEHTTSSYVVKARESEAGRIWADNAIRRFWKETRSEASQLWLPFLRRLTADYQRICEHFLPESEAQAQDRLSNAKLRTLQLWFFSRFALLRAVVDEVNRSGKSDTDSAPNEGRDEVASPFAEIASLYRDEELKRRFGDQASLNVLEMAAGTQTDPFEVIRSGNRRISLPNDPVQNISFEDYAIPHTDEWVLKFLSCLTDSVRNTDGAQATRETWYQPELSRPVENAQNGVSANDAAYHASSRIAGRRPDYAGVAEGTDAIPTFMGLVDLTIGQASMDERRMRCIVIMMRDFDDTQAGLQQSEEERREQLDVDRNDLTLYSRTFFNNVERFLTTARERQQVRLLSTDITQIARNWYTDGIDRVVRKLQQRLDKIAEGALEGGLDELRPELIETLFNSMLKDVLLQREMRRHTQDSIELESFPFDRILHIPLLFGASRASRLCYARTTVSWGQSIDEPDLPPPEDPERDQQIYKLIQSEGRHAIIGQHAKALAVDSPWSLGVSDGSAFDELRFHTEQDSESDDPDSEQPLHSLTTLLLSLAQSRDLGRFITRLFYGNPIQTLAIGGLVCNLIDAARAAERQENSSTGGQADHQDPFEDLYSRLQEALSNARSRVEANTRGETVLTDVEMDRDVYLVPVVLDDDRQEIVNLGDIADTKCLPFFREFFQSLEGRHYRYGLAPGVRSKVFYVYYSIPAPQGFIDNLTHGPCYRGVFCYIVDDETTDDKRPANSADTPVAEMADQEDIRAFVHNAMGSFRLILDLQERENRLRKPGVEEFINGMLHRLKNELNNPVIVLDKIESTLRTSALPSRETLLGRIVGAKANIAGIHALFQQLKGYGDQHRNAVTLQRYSTDWFGWQYIRSLCSALSKVSADVDASGGQSAELAVSLREITETASERIADRIKTTDSGTTLEIRRELSRLEHLICDAAKQTHGADINITFQLSFDVHSTERLFAQGSAQLPEALNILFENAFQAAWKYLDHQVTSQKDVVSPDEHELVASAKIGLLCREINDEILIDLTNSSRGITPDFLSILNAEVPQPISARQYSKGVGKKEGGSGFGHYFARRTILETCGGRAARRRLDIRTSVERDGLVNVRTNLLKDRISLPSKLRTSDVLNAAKLIFPELEPELKAVKTDSESWCVVPDTVNLNAMLSAAKTLMVADRQKKEDSLYQEVLSNGCRDIKTGVEAVIKDLVKYLTAKQESEPDPRVAEMLEKLKDRETVRRESFQELKQLLHNWRTAYSEQLEDLMVSGSERLRRRLQRFAETGTIRPVDLLTEKQRTRFKAGLMKFEPFLLTSVLERVSVVDQEAPDGTTPAEHSQLDVGIVDLFLFDLDKDGSGRPLPNRQRLAEYFRKESWQLSVSEEGDGIRLEIHLNDVENRDTRSVFRQASFDSGSTVNVLREFSTEADAYVFSQCAADFATFQKGEGSGELKMYRCGIDDPAFAGADDDERGPVATDTPTRARRNDQMLVPHVVASRTVCLALDFVTPAHEPDIRNLPS